MSGIAKNLVVGFHAFNGFCNIPQSSVASANDVAICHAVAITNYGCIVLCHHLEKSEI